MSIAMDIEQWEDAGRVCPEIVLHFDNALLASGNPAT
jgi:hypothetical protein